MVKRDYFGRPFQRNSGNPLYFFSIISQSLNVVPSVSLLVFLLVIQSSRAADQVVFSVDRATLEPGDQVMLTWKAVGQEALLLGIGKVPVEGSMALVPRQSRSYTLLVEDNGSIHSASVSIAVTGTRDIPGIPKFAEFRSPVVGQIRSVEYLKFVDELFHTLQEDLKFSPDGEFQPGRHYVVVFTNRKDDLGLIRPSDKGVRFRRIAYAIEVDEPHPGDTGVRFQVSSAIDEQLFGESAWHNTDDQELARQASARLKDRLEASNHNE